MLLITIVLYTKNLSGAKILKYENVMKIVVKTINFIRSRGLNHRQFKTFLIELNSRYSEVIYFSEVRWLSRGIVLQRFFELRNEIDLFMKAKGRSVSEISDINWICDLAFLADITSHLNELNLKLQGKDRFVTELYDNIKAFQLKLILFKGSTTILPYTILPCTILPRTILPQHNSSTHNSSTAQFFHSTILPRTILPRTILPRTILPYTISETDTITICKITFNKDPSCPLGGGYRRRPRK